MAAIQSAEEQAKLLALPPTSRLARVADIADAIAFLASPQTDLIEGQVLLVDGGESLDGLAVQAA